MYTRGGEYHRGSATPILYTQDQVFHRSHMIDMETATRKKPAFQHLLMFLLAYELWGL